MNYRWINKIKHIIDVKEKMKARTICIYFKGSKRPKSRKKIALLTFWGTKIRNYYTGVSQLK